MARYLTIGTAAGRIRMKEPSENASARIQEAITGPYSSSMSHVPISQHPLLLCPVDAAAFGPMNAVPRTGKGLGARLRRLRGAEAAISTLPRVLLLTGSAPTW
ncbi:hypothetical protein GCM10010121_090850 [Streptomyces brasiliensis]|uniref:Uncharacterized protein n=1 Tax=Streptomyces brasiliensis TaxID=1954 RepID=A0A917P859_9ACTN|nr:hypothetical protein GCM10010121_090850 [Streptomyces brasiliensis]